MKFYITNCISTLSVKMCRLSSTCS